MTYSDDDRRFDDAADRIGKLLMGIYVAGMIVFTIWFTFITTHLLNPSGELMLPKQLTSTKTTVAKKTSVQVLWPTENFDRKFSFGDHCWLQPGTTIQVLTWPWFQLYGKWYTSRALVYHTHLWAPDHYFCPDGYYFIEKTSLDGYRRE